MWHPPPSKIWIRPCSNHWEKEKSGASTCLKASFECGIEGWSNGCQPENSKAPPHPQTQTGSPGKQDRNRQSRETVRPPPAINKPMQGLLFTWRNPFVHIFSLLFLLVSHTTVFGMSPPWTDSANCTRETCGSITRFTFASCSDMYIYLFILS